MNHFLIGADTGLTGTGLVLLQVDLDGTKRFPGGGLNVAPEAATLLRRRTIRTKGDILDRLAELRGRFHEAYDLMMSEILPRARAVDGVADRVSIVVEDPTDYKVGVFGKQGNNASYKAGAAFGVVALAAYSRARESDRQVELVPSLEWIPETRRGNFRHPMKHKDARTLLRRRWPCLLHSTDHETFAGGVALYHLTGLRLNA